MNAPLAFEPPGFSIIIPTYRREDSLERVLAALAVQVYPPALMDVLVICDDSPGGTAAMVRSRKLPFNVRVFEQNHQGPAAARNLGIKHARGPFVLFLDDDVVPTPCLMAEHARAHGEARDLAVIGPLLPPLRQRSPWIRYEAESLEKQYQAMEQGLWDPTPRQFYTGNVSVRLEHLRRVGGFDPAFKRAEDVELAFRLERLGIKFVFQRSAAATHIASRPFKSWLKNAYEYGVADVVMAREKHEGYVLDAMAREVHARHPYTQRLIRLGLRHRRLTGPLPLATRVLSWLALAVNRSDIAYGLCSGVFNLNYWCGVSDRIGGWVAVEELMATHKDVGAATPATKQAIS